MKNKICLLGAIFACILLLGSCSDDPELMANSRVNQVDMTVVVPIHPSSLEYFDYVLRYQDNMGNAYTDIVQDTDGGIVLADWNSFDSGVASPGGNDCYIRTFSYDSIPITCAMTVEMVPKEGCTSVGAFIFYIPKPYIYPFVHHSMTSIESQSPNYTIEGVESILIDSMSVESFRSIYGTAFSSHCGVRDSDVGYEIFSY